MGTEWEDAPTAPVVPLALWDWPPLKDALSAHHLGQVSKNYRNNPAHGRVIRQNESARVLVHLDRSIGLVQSGAAEAAIYYASEALTDAPSEHRVGIVVVRTRQLVEELTRQRLSTPVIRGDAQHLLELTTGTDPNL